MKKSYVQLCLRHNWGQAVLAEGSVLCVQAALRLLEMATLAVLGTPTGVAWYPDPLGRDALIQGVVLLAAAGLDLLVLSPFKLSREALYWQLGAAWRPQPPGSWRRYWGAGRYGQALAWRLHRWARFAWVLFWCWLPALVLLWTGERLRLDSLRHGAADLTGAAFLLLGVAALAVDVAGAPRRMPGGTGGAGRSGVSPVAAADERAYRLVCSSICPLRVEIAELCAGVSGAVCAAAAAY